MPKQIILFQKNELPFRYKFYTLMDLLITNQVESRVESFLFMGIFYLQIISSFFAEQIGVFDHESSKSDTFLFYIQKIIRVKDLFKQNFNGLYTLLVIIFILIIFAIIHFISTCFNITRSSFYSYNKILINYYIKIFFYIVYNVNYDLSFSVFCFGSSDKNPNFTSLSCSIKNKAGLSIIAIITIIVTLFLYIFIQIYYNDSFYLSNNYYSKMSCNYDLYWGLNCLVCSCLLTQAKFLTKEIFLIYNLIISVVLFIFYLNHYLYYDKYTNIFTGLFHILYLWTSLFSLIFAYLNFKEKGIIYIITSIIVCFFYFNIKNKIESKIFLGTPYHKISNKFYLLYYFKNLIDKVNNVQENVDDKSFLSGIIQMHGVECPNPHCLLKTKEEIYLPLTNRWSNRTKKSIEDVVFLKNFLIVVMNYFLYTRECSVDMFLNLSLYYLKIIGNYCQAMYFYKKVTELKLSLKEQFSFIRLNIQISKALIEKLKPSNEPCTELENLDVSMYYKYDALSQNFIDEISNDVNLSLEFWKTFRAPLKEADKKIEFNKVFELTDKIRIAKKNVELMWNELLDIYKGVNDYFELYSEYVEQINDDDLKKRDLESLRRKNDNYGDHISQNYYSVLFNKDTGIIIANGDKGSEGIIELSNKEVEFIFKYKTSDLKGMNLIHLMPKLFAKDHSKFIERYFKIGEKRLIDKQDFKTFGKDKNNSIVKVKLALKLFPILNDNVFFVGLIKKENIDDIILMDENFIIQGMSLKLMKILNIENKFLFQENEIPFYVICRKFVGFYSIFLQGKKKPDNELTKKQNTTIIEENPNNKEKEENKKEEKKEPKDSDRDDIHQNIEINENVELEYEIKLPKFLIEYSDKTNKKEAKLGLQLMSIVTESEENETIEEYNENDLLMDENNDKKNSNIIITNKDKKNFNNTPTPDGFTPTPTPDGNTPTPTPAYDTENQFEEENFKSGLNKQSEEEKIYNERIKQYKELFDEGKFNELGDLIDSCNKESASPDYKFNFTFDRYKYGSNKQIAYIVRCIDNKNDMGKSEEESAGDLDPKIAKYKKEKAESIKPLFELLEEERKEILGLPNIFLKLSLENKKFQKLLQICKNDINSMSKTHGQKKDEVLEDENSSQTSQAGFDSGLVKKNRIEEIRSNLLMNISNFYTLKYIKLNIILTTIWAIVFCTIYIIYFSEIYNSLKDASTLNIYLFQTTLWTSELISIFISLRTLMIEKVISPQNFLFNDYLNNITNNTIYYEKMENFSKTIYYNLSNVYGYLEINIPKYLSKQELTKYYWNDVNISYINESYKSDENKTDVESFPMAIAQLLSNCITYLSETNFTPTVENLSVEKINYFYYITFLIIENGYDNILKNQINKLLIIPNILTSYNKNKKMTLIIIIIVFFCIDLIICSFYIFFILLTNKSMSDGLEKVTKIRLEKIEETIKHIEIFNSNLKKFRDRDSKSNEDNKENSDMNEDQKNDDYKNPEEANNNTRKKAGVDTSSIVGSNGFNTDNKKYISLTVLNCSVIHSIYIHLALFAFFILIYYYSGKMVNSTNKLLLVQNYVFGKLISTAISTAEIKCQMSQCKNSTKLNYDELVDMDKIQEIIKGINIFDEVSDFYNNKYLLNACGASINNNEDEKKYNYCINDDLIKSANNTDNLLKLIEDVVDNIINENQMKYNKSVTLSNGTNVTFFPQYLYNSSDFYQMEYIYYNYIIDVGDNFEEVVNNNLNRYLKNLKVLVIILVLCLGIIIIAYCLFCGIFFIRELIHYLSVSRCIMKIIPTSVIISTQELETWIENKY